MDWHKDPAEIIAEQEARLIAFDLMWSCLVHCASADARMRAAVQVDISLEAMSELPEQLPEPSQQPFAEQIETLRAALTAGLT